MSTYRPDDLVLEVSEHTGFPILDYEPFIDRLCERRPYQAEAIRIACRYLFGEKYTNLRQLTDASWRTNEKLKERYGHRQDRLRADLALGDLLACSVDHATGTGKSYLMYGVAAIALASGLVDRVLVLCPSVTIEDGLTEKFRDLATRKDLLALLPGDAAVRVPEIVNAYEQTVPDGAICVENIHAAYDGSKSSIRDSFGACGERTLVINDEAHHIFSKDNDMKKWLEFLLDPTYEFARVLNVSGTCYIGNDYFPDVVHRYSLSQALDDRLVKEIRYLDEGDFKTEDARWAAVLENHEQNQQHYPDVKPLTIFITNNVASAKTLHQEFCRFLAQERDLTADEAAEQALIVTSHKDHAANLPQLRLVDRSDNPVEFIVSVSMLTEGWDVKNVFQIVPHEKRAFDSKLLISQVLGRGLRLPAAYPDAEVIVFNHAKWSAQIRNLVDEVLETNHRIVASVVPSSSFNFTLHSLDLQKTERTEAAPEQEPRGRAAGEPLKLAHQGDHVTRTEQARVRGGERDEQTYRRAQRTRDVSVVVADVVSRLAAIDLERGTELATAIDPAELEAEIRSALEAEGITDGVVSEENTARILAWLTPARAPRARTKRIEQAVDKLREIQTAAMPARSVGRSQLSKNASIALITDNNKAERLNPASSQYDLLDEILADDDLPRGAILPVRDLRAWRTPLDVVLVAYRPEREFLRHLLQVDAASPLTGWVKSPDSGFYSIPFTWTRNGVIQYAGFNPDWFLRIGDDTLVVETKDNDDINDENRAKLKAAEEHFATVNRLRGGAPGSYRFLFAAPDDFDALFGAIEAGEHMRFTSSLHADLRS